MKVDVNFNGSSVFYKNGEYGETGLRRLKLSAYWFDSRKLERVSSVIKLHDMTKGAELSIDIPDSIEYYLLDSRAFYTSSDDMHTSISRTTLVYRGDVYYLNEEISDILDLMGDGYSLKCFSLLYDFDIDLLIDLCFEKSVYGSDEDYSLKIF